LCKKKNGSFYPRFVLGDVVLIVIPFPLCYSVLKYDMQNLEIPTISILGTLVKSGVRVLVYRLVSLLDITISPLVTLSYTFEQAKLFFSAVEIKIQQYLCLEHGL
jgi:hypothetical protein